MVDGSGVVLVPAFGVGGPFGTSAVFLFSPALPQCGTYTFNISNALADLSGELLVPPSVPPVLTGLIPPPAPTLNSYTTMTTASQVTITGSAPGAEKVEVLWAPQESFLVDVVNNTFSTDIPLASNRINPIFFTALSTCDGARSAPMVARVTQDTELPNLFIDFPADGSDITTATTDVAGRVGDLLSGFAGLNVQLIVNGDTANPVPAVVDVGIGNNGTFFAAGVPLGPTDQPTVIEAIATDALTNTISKQITVTKVDIPANAHRMTIVSGNNQESVPIYTQLADPIVVRMTKPDGVTPFAYKVVTFEVTRSDGRLAGAPGYNCLNVGALMLQCRTDANGEVAALWTLGGDAGCGNNRVEVGSQSIAGTVAFCASALPGPVKQINIGTGNNQKAEAGGPAPEPLRVWVSDGCNGIKGVPVQFTVIRGGGKVRAPGTTQDLDSVTVPTLDTGHAAVNFTLGPEHGSNVIEATLPDYPNHQPARFTIYGLKRTEGQPTSFFGIVLNNAGQPIQGAECLLVVGAMATEYVYTDIDGRFRLDNVLGSGDADLYVDGSTAFHVGGATCTAPACDVEPGTYPGLHFEMVVVPNAANSLPMPVLLPPLNPDNVKDTYSATPGDPDTILTVEGMEGLEMRVRAGSMKMPGGVPAPDGQPIYLNQVHNNDIPMPIPDGASPPFAWTLQPAGATFNPPIEIRYPNMSGLPAGAIAYFLSFNHDTSRFEIIASGHVIADGSTIVTDPGTGLSLAGWGCNCPPYSVTGDCCTGCDADCCEGTCCNCACCEGECCGGVCCAGGKCCGGECCSDCCGGECCKNGEQCCGGQCCKDCCDGKCCDTVCCDGVCCPEGTTICCDGKCCPSGTKTCCDGECCMGPCCEATGECCAPTDKSCCNNECCTGPCCENTGECCPADKESCCNDECCDGPCCGENDDICCEAGATCCGLDCCPPETPQCCDETGTLCCPEDQDCCDTKCCPPGWTCCNGECCEGPCCENTGECCPERSKSCCNDLCCEGPCCENTGQCCPATAESCCNDECCEGPCCDNRCCHQAGGKCCATAPDGCCGPTQLCCEATGGSCCPQGTTCCGETDCCPVGIVCCDGSCCPSGQMCCGQTTCCKPNKCCGQEECCADNEVCCNGTCEVPTCSLALDPGMICPGGSVDLTGVAICEPECVSMSMVVEIVEPAMQAFASATVNPASVPCGPFKTPITVTVNLSPDAAPGAFTVRLTGRIVDGGEIVCEDQVETTVTIDECVDLTFDAVPDDQETNPGGFLCVNDDDDDASGMADKDEPGPTIGEDDLVPLTVSLSGGWSGAGTVTLSCEAGCSRVRFYASPDRTNPVTLPLMWSVPTPELPATFYVEGYERSLTARDVELKAVYDGEGGPCEDHVKLTVVRANLLVDTDRNAVVDNADQPGKDTWVADRGAIFMVNYDDDDPPPPPALGKPDAIDFDDRGEPIDEDFIINGLADKDDIAPLVIKATGPTDNVQFFLQMEADDLKAVHIFEERVAGASVLWGGWTNHAGDVSGTMKSLDITSLVRPNSDLDLGIEALFFPGFQHSSFAMGKFDGQVDVELIVQRTTGATSVDPTKRVCGSKVRIRVAPYLMLPNTQDAIEVWMVDSTGFPGVGIGSDDIMAKFGGVSRRAGSPSQWFQDHVQIGYTAMPGQDMHLTLRLPYGEQQSWPVAFEPMLGIRPLLRPDRGILRVRNTSVYGPLPPGPPFSGDYGGNLEIVPPSEEWALGRIVYGSTMGTWLRDFLGAQVLAGPNAVQQPFSIDVGWLAVGHVDEIVSFLPGGTRGFKVLVASPAYAEQLLRTGDPARGIAPPSDDTALFALGAQASGTASNSITTDSKVYLFDGVAHGLIKVVAGVALSDGETVTISDGALSRTFEFEKSGGVAPGNVAVPITDAMNTQAVRDGLLAAINGSALNVDTVPDDPPLGTPDKLIIINQDFGTAGNVPITETVAPGGFTVQGMAGGEAAADGRDFTTTPWQLVRLYDGPGAGQVGFIDGPSRRGKGWLSVKPVAALETVFRMTSKVVSAPTAEPTPPASVYEMVVNPSRIRDGTAWLTVEPDPASHYVIAVDTKHWTRSGGTAPFPALVSVLEVKNNTELWALNAAAETEIVAEKSKIQTEMGAATGGGFFLRDDGDPSDDSLTGDPDSDFLVVPVLYFGNWSGSLTPRGNVAFVPGLANVQPASAAMIVFPTPFTPNGLGMDVFEQATTTIIGAGTGFADDWDLYHRLDGEVHCATEVVRILFGMNWWENQP